MKQKERRKNIRIPLLTEACTWISGKMTYSSQILNIDNSGLFIKSDQMPETKEIDLRFALPGDLGVFEVPSKVVRKQWAAVKKKGTEVGFAVQFQIEQPGHQKIMDSYCVYLRNKQIIQVSKKIIEELFSRKAPGAPKEPIV